MKLYDKIQKLLNMANGSVQGNEAEVALKMAHDLMEANNITMEELDAAGRDKELGKLTQEMYQEKAFKIWEKTLMHAISKLFDCEIVYSNFPGSRKMQQKVIGREGNVKTTTMMYEWIREKAWKDAKQKFGGNSVSACNSYGVGWYLPAINELNSFYDALPFIKTILESQGVDVNSLNIVWSSTEEVNSPEFAYLFDFNKGAKFSIDKAVYGKVFAIKKVVK